MSASSSQVPEVTCDRMLPLDLKDAFLGRTCRLGPSVLERCSGGITARAACAWPEAVITPIEGFTHLLCTSPSFDVRPSPQTPEDSRKLSLSLYACCSILLITLRLSIILERSSSATAAACAPAQSQGMATLMSRRPLASWNPLRHAVAVR